MNIGDNVKFKQFGHTGNYVVGHIVEFYDVCGMEMCTVKSTVGDTWDLAIAFLEVLK